MNTLNIGACRQAIIERMEELNIKFKKGEIDPIHYYNVQSFNEDMLAIVERKSEVPNETAKELQ